MLIYTELPSNVLVTQGPHLVINIQPTTLHFGTNRITLTVLISQQSHTPWCLVTVRVIPCDAGGCLCSAKDWTGVLIMPCKVLLSPIFPIVKRSFYCWASTVGLLALEDSDLLPTFPVLIPNLWCYYQNTMSFKCHDVFNAFSDAYLLCLVCLLLPCIWKLSSKCENHLTKTDKLSFDEIH